MENSVLNCIKKLNLVIQGNNQIIEFYSKFKSSNSLEKIIPSIIFLEKQKQRFKNAAQFEINRLKKETTEFNLKSSPVVLKLDFHKSALQSTNSFLLKLIAEEQNFIQFYLEIISQLNPEGSVYQRLLNHINEMNLSIQLLERNVTHQQELLSA